MRTAVFALAGLLAASASAEVRVVRTFDGPRLLVRPAPEGTWTPLGGPAREGVVNPAGDLFGDGAPSSAGSSTALLAAWLRSGSELRLLSATGPRDIVEGSVSVAEAWGQPVVARMGDVQVVLWQQGAESPWVGGIGWNGSPSEVSALQPGVILGVLPIEGGFRLVTHDVASFEILVGTIVFSAPLPMPVPIEVQRIPILWEGSNLLRALDSDLGTQSVACAEVAGGILRVALPMGRGGAWTLLVGTDVVGVPAAGRASQGSCQGVLRSLR